MQTKRKTIIMTSAAAAEPAPEAGHFWAVLLAGGEGIRLRKLTMSIVGDDRPKQFCPVAGADSLLCQTRFRLDPLACAERQVFVVSRAHEMYYSRELADVKDSLVIAQPMNRGTAVGIAAALVRIKQADPEAIVGFFPCDHYYSDDESFRSTVRSAISNARQFPDSLVTIGADAAYAETDYGWIEPGPAVSEATLLYRVNRFWEKPALSQARVLLQRGCLWNTFVTVGSAAAFLEAVCSQASEVVHSLMQALPDNDLAAAYSRLPSIDFSRDILTHQVKRLLVLRDADSGWADLGSPDRVLGLFAGNARQPAWCRPKSSSSLQARDLVGRPAGR